MVIEGHLWNFGFGRGGGGGGGEREKKKKKNVRKMLEKGRVGGWWMSFLLLLLLPLRPYAPIPLPSPPPTPNIHLNNEKYFKEEKNEENERGDGECWVEG